MVLKYRHHLLLLMFHCLVTISLQQRDTITQFQNQNHNNSSLAQQQIPNRFPVDEAEPFQNLSSLSNPTSIPQRRDAAQAYTVVQQSGYGGPVQPVQPVQPITVQPDTTVPAFPSFQPLGAGAYSYVQQPSGYGAPAQTIYQPQSTGYSITTPYTTSPATLSSYNTQPYQPAIITTPGYQQTPAYQTSYTPSIGPYQPVSNQPTGYSSPPSSYQPPAGYGQSQVYPPPNPYGSGQVVAPETSGYAGLNGSLYSNKYVVLGGSTSGDPCFRKFANSIVVNAQPFDRKTGIGIDECKQRCLSYQTGVYTCKALVYDNQNQVCDLFAHTGNAYPARLIQYYGRDYYEPTGVCPAIITERPYGATPSVGPPSPVPLGGNVTCPAGTEVRFLRVQGQELVVTDGTPLQGLTEQQCLKICTDNRTPTGQQVPCRSFNLDSSSGTCTISQSAAAPSGTGKLRVIASRNYYEKFCLDSQAAQRCPNLFERIPQEILVGYAETVTDARSYQECLNACVNAKTLFGFDCISGMYYFQEPELNCILNTESKKSQPNLFTQENVDVVDYFEPGCTRTRLAVQSTLRKELSSNTLQQSDNVPRSANIELTPFGEWTQWSGCDRSTEGRRVRFKICGDNWKLKDCPMEAEWCNVPNETIDEQSGNENRFRKRFEDVAPVECQVGDCCPYKGSCRIGRREFNDGTAQWCTEPCNNETLTTNFWNRT